MGVSVIVGDCRLRLRELPDEAFHTCVTSPPYFGLRDYGADRQIGQEATPSAFVAEMVEVFREVRRVLRPDGTLWLNLGDSYAGSWGAQSRDHAGKHAPNASAISANQIKAAARRASGTGSIPPGSGLKPKDLIGIPWRVALALQADGWWLRRDIIWSKPNPMPESVTDRCTSSHEYIFHLSKSEDYFYDAAAIRNPPSQALIDQVEAGYAGEDTKDYGGGRAQSASGTKARIIAGARARVDKQRGHGRRHEGFNGRWDALSREEQLALGSNKRSVWEVATQPFRGAHFATFPPKLIEPCILAGCPAGGFVLDPFGGAGTTGLVADRLGRSATLIELNPEYAAIAEARVRADAGMFSDVEVAA